MLSACDDDQFIPLMIPLGAVVFVVVVTVFSVDKWEMENNLQHCWCFFSQKPGGCVLFFTFFITFYSVVFVVVVHIFSLLLWNKKL